MTTFSKRNKGKLFPCVQMKKQELEFRMFRENIGAAAKMLPLIH